MENNAQNNKQPQNTPQTHSAEAAVLPETDGQPQDIIASAPSQSVPFGAPAGDVQSTISDVKIFIEKLKADLPEVFSSAGAQAEVLQNKAAAAGKVLYRGDMLECVVNLTPQNKENEIVFEDNFLTINIIDGEQEVSSLIENWLRQKAKEILPAEITRRAQEMNVQFNSVVIKDQRTLWGSCSSKKNLNFSYRIIKMPLAVADYLIVHELAHLIFFNHGSDYWQTVEQYVPSFKEHRKWLNANRLAVMADCNVKYIPPEGKDG